MGIIDQWGPLNKLIPLIEDPGGGGGGGGGVHICQYTVTDKYFQNFRSKVKVAERLKTLFGHISGTNGRRDSGLVSKCRGMSQPTWWRGGRPSLIALL